MKQKASLQRMKKTFVKNIAKYTDIHTELNIST